MTTLGGTLHTLSVFYIFWFWLQYWLPSDQSHSHAGS